MPICSGVLNILPSAYQSLTALAAASRSCGDAEPLTAPTVATAPGTREKAIAILAYSTGSATGPSDDLKTRWCHGVTPSSSRLNTLLATPDAHSSASSSGIPSQPARFMTLDSAFAALYQPAVIRGWFALARPSPTVLTRPFSARRPRPVPARRTAIFSEIFLLSGPNTTSPRPSDTISMAVPSCALPNSAIRLPCPSEILARPRSSYSISGAIFSKVRPIAMPWNAGSAASRPARLVMIFVLAVRLIWLTTSSSMAFLSSPGVWSITRLTLSAVTFTSCFSPGSCFRVPIILEAKAFLAASVATVGSTTPSARPTATLPTAINLRVARFVVVKPRLSRAIFAMSAAKVLSLKLSTIFLLT